MARPVSLTLSFSPRSLQALLQFHTTLYSANIMKLAVIGRESLDELQKWVVPLFSTVRNTQQPPHFMPPVPAFPPSTMATVLKVVPVKEMRRLSLGFPLPIDWQEQAKMRVRAPCPHPLPTCVICWTVSSLCRPLEPRHFSL
jgi:secreted Zn-dependent insulinase-like peptidase